MNDMFPAQFGYATSHGGRRYRASPHESFGPAIGVFVASGTSLLSWVAVVAVLRWAAQALF